MGQNRAHKFICKKMASCINLQLPIVIFKNRLIQTGTCIKENVHAFQFSANRVSRYFQLAIRILKNQALRTCTACPLMDIQADFEINRPSRYQITAKRNYFHRRQTARRTNGQTEQIR